MSQEKLVPYTDRQEKGIRILADLFGGGSAPSKPPLAKRSWIRHLPQGGRYWIVGIEEEKQEVFRQEDISTLFTHRTFLLCANN